MGSDAKFCKIVILSRFVAVRLANPKSITISDANYMYTRGLAGDDTRASGMVEQRIVKEKFCMLQPDGKTKIVGDVEGWVYSE